MELCKYKDLSLYLEKKQRILLLYFYEDWCNSITEVVDAFFKTKYDLNKMYIKIKVSKSTQIINTLDIETYPIIKIYKKGTLFSQLYCNTKMLSKKLDEIYNIL